MTVTATLIICDACDAGVAPHRQWPEGVKGSCASRAASAATPNAKTDG